MQQFVNSISRVREHSKTEYDDTKPEPKQTSKPEPQATSNPQRTSSYGFSGHPRGIQAFCDVLKVAKQHLQRVACGVNKDSISRVIARKTKPVHTQRVCK